MLGAGVQRSGAYKYDVGAEPPAAAVTAAENLKGTVTCVTQHDHDPGTIEGMAYPDHDPETVRGVTQYDHGLGAVRSMTYHARSPFHTLHYCSEKTTLPPSNHETVRNLYTGSYSHATRS